MIKTPCEFHMIPLKINNFNHMNILITGAFGFVGANLSRALAAAGKHRLIALDLFQLVAQSPPVYPNGAELHRHYSKFVSRVELHPLNGQNIDAIIHLAGNTGKFGIIPAFSKL
jgi:nucleoside-diphosphate-sugar epimerase